MSIEKLTSSRSESLAIKLKEFLADADLVEVSIKDSSGKNIIGKLVEIIWDEKAGSTWVTIRQPYETELSRLKLENGESITAHKTKTFRVW